MRKRIDRERIRAFVLRRKANALGLTVITALSVLVTVVSALMRSSKTGIFAVVSMLLLLLCAVQSYRMRSSYRTMRSFRGFRKKKRSPES